MLFILIHTEKWLWLIRYKYKFFASFDNIFITQNKLETRLPITRKQITYILIGHTSISIAGPTHVKHLIHCSLQMTKKKNAKQITSVHFLVRYGEEHLRILLCKFILLKNYSLYSSYSYIFICFWPKIWQMKIQF